MQSIPLSKPRNYSADLSSLVSNSVIQNTYEIYSLVEYKRKYRKVASVKKSRSRQFEKFFTFFVFWKKISKIFDFSDLPF